MAPLPISRATGDPVSLGGSGGPPLLLLLLLSGDGRRPLPYSAAHLPSPPPPPPRPIVGTAAQAPREDRRARGRRGILPPPGGRRKGATFLTARHPPQRKQRRVKIGEGAPQKFSLSLCIHKGGGGLGARERVTFSVSFPTSHPHLGRGPRGGTQPPLGWSEGLTVPGKVEKSARAPGAESGVRDSGGGREGEGCRRERREGGAGPAGGRLRLPRPVRTALGRDLAPLRPARGLGPPEPARGDGGGRASGLSVPERREGGGAAGARLALAAPSSAAAFARPAWPPRSVKAFAGASGAPVLGGRRKGGGGPGAGGDSERHTHPRAEVEGASPPAAVIWGAPFLRGSCRRSASPPIQQRRLASVSHSGIYCLYRWRLCIERAQANLFARWRLALGSRPAPILDSSGFALPCPAVRKKSALPPLWLGASFFRGRGNRPSRRSSLRLQSPRFGKGRLECPAIPRRLNGPSLLPREAPSPPRRGL